MYLSLLTVNTVDQISSQNFSQSVFYLFNVFDLVDKDKHLVVSVLVYQLKNFVRKPSQLGFLIFKDKDCLDNIFVGGLLHQWFCSYVNFNRIFIQNVCT